MFDYLTKTQVNNLKKFTVKSINCFVWELGIEFEKAVTDGEELNFDLSSLHFNVKRYIYVSKSYSQFDCKY